MEAIVNETLTRIELSDSTSTPFHSSKIKLEFLESTPDTFKPGLIYSAIVRDVTSCTALQRVRGDVYVYVLLL